MAGRALQKHAGREGSVFRDVKFSHKTANEAAEKVLKEIINAPEKLMEPQINGATITYDKVTKRGFSVSREGAFNGFRELK